MPVVSKEVITTTLEPNGDVQNRITGYLVEQITNVSTGKSIIRNISGPVLITQQPDGSHSDVFAGTGVYLLGPTDIPAGPDLFIGTGYATGTLTTSGQFILIGPNGSTEDVCSTLS